MRPRLNWILRLVLTLALLAGAQEAEAQTFTFKAYDGVEDDDLNEVELNRFFNMARCLCDANTTSPPYSFYVGINSQGPYEDQEVYFLLGDYCDEEVSRPDCYEFDSINFSNFNEQQDIYLPVNWIVDPENGSCTEGRDTSTLFLFMTAEKNSPVANYPIDYDTKPPGVPTVTRARGGEGAVIVYWERPEDDDQDIDFYNILCEIEGRAPDVASASKAEWTTTLEVCGQDLTPDDVVVDPDGGVEDAGVDGGVPDGGLEDGGMEDAGVEDAAMEDAGEEVDGSVATGCYGSLREGDYPRACFVCGSTGPTVRDTRIDGLHNGVEVRVAVVAVDETRNVSYVSNVETATPMPTTDFAERYRESGGSGKGGFCFVATVAYGSYDHGHVKVLRRFRDGVLMKSALGRRFVRWYYRNGERLARPFQGSTLARGLLRLALLPCVAVAYLWVHLGGVVLFFIFGLLVGGGVMTWRRRNKRASTSKAEAVTGETEPSSGPEERS